MVLTFFVMVVVALLTLRFTHYADRRRIERHVIEQGGEVLSIERDYPIGRMLISERNTTFWRVRYRAKDGSIRMADCFASFLRCKVYREEMQSAVANPARTRLEIIPGVGIGPVRHGMSPGEVLAVFTESQKYEDWMGGNLNDALLFNGLVFQFDACSSSGPLPDSRLHLIIVHDREDATLFGRLFRDWTRDDLIKKMRDQGWNVVWSPSGAIGAKSLLDVSFDESGFANWVEIYHS